MPAPINPRNLLLLLFVFGFLIATIQLGLLTIAFDKLGLSPFSAYLLLICSLLGSVINLPLFRLRTDLQPPAELPPERPLFPGFPLWNFSSRTVVALNVGGGLIPIAFSLYLYQHSEVRLLEILQGVFFVSMVSFFFSRPIRGIGIGMPILIAPLSAALIAVLLNDEASAPLAYISGTMGVLIGADLMRLKDIRRLGAPFAAIGGAGTFDGIFITGIVAVLLA
jgi:uncharacterized membrane protein